MPGRLHYPVCWQHPVSHHNSLHWENQCAAAHPYQRKGLVSHAHLKHALRCRNTACACCLPGPASLPLPLLLLPAHYTLLISNTHSLIHRATPDAGVHSPFYIKFRAYLCLHSCLCFCFYCQQHPVLLIPEPVVVRCYRLEQLLPCAEHLRQQYTAQRALFRWLQLSSDSQQLCCCTRRWCWQAAEPALGQLSNYMAALLTALSSPPKIIFTAVSYASMQHCVQQLEL